MLMSKAGKSLFSRPFPPSLIFPSHQTLHPLSFPPSVIIMKVTLGSHSTFSLSLLLSPTYTHTLCALQYLQKKNLAQNAEKMISMRPLHFLASLSLPEKEMHSVNFDFGELGLFFIQ